VKNINGFKNRCSKCSGVTPLFYMNFIRVPLGTRIQTVFRCIQESTSIFNDIIPLYACCLKGGGDVA
jgi:hypothetical protein